jgi:hypothetical protein
MGEEKKRWERIKRALGLAKELPKPSVGARALDVDAEGFGLWAVQGASFVAPLWVGRLRSERAATGWGGFDDCVQKLSLRGQGWGASGAFEGSALTQEGLDPKALSDVAAALACRALDQAQNGASSFDVAWEDLGWEPARGEALGQGLQRGADARCASPAWRVFRGQTPRALEWEAAPWAFDDHVASGRAPFERQDRHGPQNGDAPNVDESRLWRVKALLEGQWVEAVVHFQWARELIFCPGLDEWAWDARVSVELNGHPLFDAAGAAAVFAPDPWSYPARAPSARWGTLDSAGPLALIEALTRQGDPKDVGERGWSPLRVELFEADALRMERELSERRELAVASVPQGPGMDPARAAQIERAWLGEQAGAALAGPSRKGRL